MKRRDFIQAAALTGASLLAGYRHQVLNRLQTEAEKQSEWL